MLSYLQATNIKFHDGMVPRETKEQLLGQKGVVLWFTGARQPAVQCSGGCSRLGPSRAESSSSREAAAAGKRLHALWLGSAADCLLRLAVLGAPSVAAGLSGSGKSTVACTLEHALVRCPVVVGMWRA